MRKHLMAWLLPCLCGLAPMAQAETNGVESTETLRQLKEQVELLQNQVDRMDGTIHKQQETHAIPPSTAPATAENSGNPAISVIGTFAGDFVQGGQAANGGKMRSRQFLPLSEAEFRFGADVDPHTRLDITVTGNAAGLAVEEGFLTARLPAGFNLRAGRSFLPIGCSNPVHPHALIYSDIPNGLVNLFGAGKFSGDGILLDRPLFIGQSVQTFTAGLFQTGNTVAFDPTGTNRFAALGHWTGLWELGSQKTVELGATYVNGRNGTIGNGRTDILGGHLALKAIHSDRSGWTLEGEWNRSRRDIAAGRRIVTDGAYLLGIYDIDRNWHLFTRYDLSKQTAQPDEQAYSGGMAWKISEFQSLTLQYKHVRHALPEVAANLGLASGQSANEVLFRWVVAIGPHGAHPY